MINWSFLDYFIAAAREENFSKAANSLYYSQSYLSKKIAALEEELDVTLFERKGKKVILSPAGEHLYQEASKINQAIDALKQDIKKYQRNTNQQKCPLTIFTDSYSNALTQEILQQYRIFHPEYAYVITTEAMGCTNEDSDILCYFIQSGQTSTSEALYYDQEKIYINAKAPIAKKKKLTLKDLAGYTCIIIDTVKRQQEWEKEVAPNNPDIHFRHVSNVFDAMNILSTDEKAFEIWNMFSHEFMPLYNTIGIPLSTLGALELHIDLKDPLNEASKAFLQIAKSFCQSIS